LEGNARVKEDKHSEQLEVLADGQKDCIQKLAKAEDSLKKMLGELVERS